MPHPHDPAEDPEAEGIPDLQEGTPEQQRASDPQRMPVPGDEPTVAQYRGNTANEAREGDSLEQRLAQERPERPTEELPEPGEGDTVPGDDTDISAEDAERHGPGQERAGLLSDPPDPDRPRNQDVYSEESPASGVSAEEDAVRVTDEDSALAADRAHARSAPGWENESALADRTTPDEDGLATGAVREDLGGGGTAGSEEVRGAQGSAGTADAAERAERALRETATGEEATPTATTGNDVQEQEIAEGPVEGVQPGERLARGPWQPPVEVDAPDDPAVPGASGDPDAVRRQKKAGGP
ncbi:DUF5709 domain-containing protein [Streptomyces sp. NPDC059740]|uniref:DUF5709 domain-containing protein n=1 Tax=Streptomyces sp. NPDC059740 TaxID=3346926 RepID=UPI00364919D6